MASCWMEGERKEPRRMCQKYPTWIPERLIPPLLWKECRGIDWRFYKTCSLPAFCFPLFLSTINDIFCKVKNVTLYWLLTWIFSASSKMPKLCSWNTWENRNALSWKIRNLENHYWIILRSVEAIAFCLSCHLLGTMNLEVLVKRHHRFRFMTVFVIGTVMSYSGSPMYYKYSLHSQWTLLHSDMFNVFFQLVHNIFIAIFF